MNISTKSQLNELTYETIGAAIHVHKSLGPGLLESIYHQCLKIELAHRGFRVETEKKVQVVFNSIELETNLRCDLFVEDSLVLELKAVAGLIPIHEAQLMTYMKLLSAPKGLLINFNCFNLFKEGQRTFVNEYYRKLPE